MTHKAFALWMTFFCLCVAGCQIPLDGDGDSPSSGGSGHVKDQKIECDDDVKLDLDQRVLEPDVMLVMDRSASMKGSFNNNISKWAAVRSSVVDIVLEYSSLDFGLQFFPTRGSCVVEHVSVLFGDEITNATVIESLNNTGISGGSTPTLRAMRNIRGYVESMTAENRNQDGIVVLLATDGGQSGKCGRTPAATEAQILFDEHAIRTFVLGFGEGTVGTVSGTLDNIAVVGGTERYYQADDPEELLESFGDIMSKVTIPSCSFSLNHPPVDEEKLAISIAGKVIERSKENGWSYHSELSEIRFHGGACKSIEENGFENVEVDLGCLKANIE